MSKQGKRLSNSADVIGTSKHSNEDSSVSLNCDSKTTTAATTAKESTMPKSIPSSSPFSANSNENTRSTTTNAKVSNQKSQSLDSISATTMESLALENSMPSSSGFVFSHHCPSFYPEGHSTQADSLTTAPSALFVYPLNNNIVDFNSAFSGKVCCQTGSSNGLSSPLLSISSGNTNSPSPPPLPNLPHISTMSNTSHHILFPVHPTECMRKYDHNEHGSTTPPSIYYLGYAADMTVSAFPETTITPVTTSGSVSSSPILFKSSPYANRLDRLKLGPSAMLHLEGPMDAAIQARRHLLNTAVIHRCYAKVSIPGAHVSLVTEEWLTEHMDPSLQASFSLSSSISPSVEIVGTWWQVEEARLFCQQSFDQLNGLFTKSINVPINAIGSVIGPAKKLSLEFLMNTGAIVESTLPIYSQVEANNRLSTGKVYITAKSSETAQTVAQDILNHISALVPLTNTISLSERAIDWMLSQKQAALLKILHTNGTSIQIHPTCASTPDIRNVSVYGLNETLIKSTCTEICELAFQFQSATIWLTTRENTLDPLSTPPALTQLAQLVSELVKKTQLTEVEWYTVDNAVFISLYGVSKEIQKALGELQRHSLFTSYDAQIHYFMSQPEDIREFVSGKKNGKLLKIMKETGVDISLAPQPHEKSAIQFELTAKSVDAIFTALELLYGELPAQLTFYLPETHHRRLIGHGGQTIQKVMKKYAVYIKFLNVAETKDTYGNPTDRMQSPAVRIDNVMMKTPMKNGSALALAKQDVLEMAELFEAPMEKQSICISRRGLLMLSRGSLSKFAALVKSSRSMVDVSISTSNAYLDGDLMKLRLLGSTTAITKFTKSLCNESKDQETFSSEELRHLMHQGSPTLPASPTMTTSSMDSSAGYQGHYGQSLSPTMAQPELFSLFNSAFSRNPGNYGFRMREMGINHGELPCGSSGSATEATDTDISWASRSPDLLSISISNLALSPQNKAQGLHSLEKSPRISYNQIVAATATLSSPKGVHGNEERSKWHSSTPKLSLYGIRSVPHNGTTGVLDDNFLSMDWRVIAAEQYRRRMSSIFNH